LPGIDELGSYIEFFASFGRLNWAHRGLPAPATVPLGRTTIIGPVDISISESGPNTILHPYLNTGKAFLFYIDAYRNMHAPENCHSLTLCPFEIGPAEPSEELTGRLSLGKLPLPGDYNRDGRVDISDITPLAVHWGKDITDENSYLDQNDDGEISVIEILYIASYYGDTLDDW
jgi:hypothetical protein